MKKEIEIPVRKVLFDKGKALLLSSHDQHAHAMDVYYTDTHINCIYYIKTANVKYRFRDRVSVPRIENPILAYPENVLYRSIDSLFILIDLFKSFYMRYYGQ